MAGIEHLRAPEQFEMICHSFVWQKHWLKQAIGRKAKFIHYHTIKKEF